MTLNALMKDILDAHLGTGEERAQKGMKKVLDKELEAWKTVATEAILALPVGFRFTPELITNKAGLPPRHPNSMGALLNHLKALGVVKWTGEVRKSQRPERQAGMVRVWERVAGSPSRRQLARMDRVHRETPEKENEE